MSKTVYDHTEAELFRLTCAYTAIRDPKIRAELLYTVEAWAKDQWHGVEEQGKS